MVTIYIDATREILPILTSDTNWLYNISSGICGIVGVLIGAFIGGRYVLKSADKSHQHSIELSDMERKKQENITIISLVEELKVIMECYKNEFIQLFSSLKPQKYLTTTYVVMQE